VKAPTTHSSVLDALMGAYDLKFPGASPFARSSYEYECRKVLDALEEVGYVPVLDDVWGDA
jgi:hypothetical protein